MRILIACGGTAGHMFPGLALAGELKREEESREITIVISTHPREREYLKVATPLLKGLHIETVSATALPYNISFKTIVFTARLLRAFLKSFFIILKCRPQVVVGFGGYSSFAPLIMARVIGIPTLIHEQNVTPGRANRLLAGIVDRIAVSFDSSNGFFSRVNPSKGVLKTGLPLRRHILEHKSSPLRHCEEPFNSISGEEAISKKFTILVLGGSQGAYSINELMLNCLDLMDRTVSQRLQLIHLSGNRDLCRVKSRYETLGISHQVFGFIKDMAGVYKVTDLMVSRCGAGAIFEAAAFGLPCIFLPYPCAAQHQRENALFLQRRGAALVLDEKASSPQDLKKILLELIADEEMRQNLSRRIKMLECPQASRNLKEEVIALYRHSNYTRGG